PMDVDVWGLYVNTDIVDRYNEGAADSDKLPYEPETWSDLLDMAEKLSVVKDGEVSRVGLSATDVGQRYATFLASARTMQIGNDGMANFDTPAFNDYLTFIRELKELNIDRHGFNDRVAFTAGNLAMIYGSAYTGNYFKNYFKDGNYVYIPQPKWDRIGSETAGTPEQNSTKGGLLGGFGWVIPKPLDKANRGEDWEARVDMAAKFMKLATTDATLNAKWISFCGSLPANKEAWSLDIVEQDQTLKRISEIADDSQARPSLYYFPILDQQTIVANIVKFSNIGGSFSQKTNAELIEIITTDTNDYISLYTE
ncbi:MAG: extracellular solute-binding protein, partial [Christensenellales bacterium]